MNNNNNNDMIETRINELIDKSLEESITAEEFAELNQIIASDKKYASYYMRCMKYRQTLYQAQSLIKLPVEPSADQMLQKMAEYETVAPAIAVKKEPVKPAAQISIDTRQVKIVHNVNKPFVVLTMLSLAAMILLLIFVQMNPYVNPEVVTVVDSMNARYADPELKIPAGSRLSTKFGLVSLKQGIVKLLYDDTNVEVIIEAPAEYEFKSAKDLCLYSGRAFATVPQTGKGFTIRTQHSRIVDLGTQFGVVTDSAGDTEVHVFKGKTMLVSGTQKESILNLLAGSAKKVCNNGDTVNDIQVNPNAFVQEIHSQTGFIWRGESAIPLINLLTGGIFNASPSGIEIDPAMGKQVFHENYVSGIKRDGRMEYQKMDSLFVDGTFVPLGDQPQIISSTKLSCQFPKTSGSFHYNLSDQKIVYDGYTSSRYPLYLTSSSQDKPLIFLHPNMGITINLDKIRQKMPSLVLEHFRATCGIAPCAADALKKAYPDGNIPAEENPSMDFRVLIDGKASQTLTGIGLNSGVQNINVEIHPTDRFLTLVSTDGNQCFKYDWFILADPVLEISAAQ